MLLRNADGAVSPHPDSDPKAFAMDVALKYPRAMTPRYATNMNGRRLRLGDGTSPTSPWRLFGRLIFFAERNSAPTGANELEIEKNLEANEPLGDATCCASSFHLENLTAEFMAWFSLYCVKYPPK